MSLQPFTPVPATRAVDEGDPPVDMNNTSLELLAMGGSGNVMNANYSGGADPSGVADSTTAIGDAVTNFQSTGMPVIFPPGTYKVSSALNWKVPGLQVITAGAANTTITQATANTPILQVAGEGQRIGGLTLTYASQQSSSNTSAIGVEFGDDSVGSCFLSVFEDLRVYLAAQGMAINPAVSSVAGLFSCYFGNTEIFGYSINAMKFVGSNANGANCTGCVFDNTYIHNNYTGSDANSTDYPLSLQGWDEVVFNQVNIEHAEIFDSGAAVFSHCGNVVVNAMHLEHLETDGTPGWGLIGVGTGTGTVLVNGVSVRFCTFTGASLNSLFRVTGGSAQNIICNGINSTASQLYTSNYANAGAGCSGVITDGSQVTYFPAQNWTTFGTGGNEDLLNETSGDNQSPVAGTWYYADLLVPFTTTVTGIIAGVPSGGGTDAWNAALWPYAGGTALAHSGTAGTTTASGNPGNFRMPFTAAVTIPGPAAYKAGIQSNGTTAKFQAFSNTTEGFVTGSVSGVFGSVPTLSAGTAYTVNAGPMLKTY